jgi:hypothetical protein
MAVRPLELIMNKRLGQAYYDPPFKLTSPNLQEIVASLMSDDRAPNRRTVRFTARHPTLPGPVSVNVVISLVVRHTTMMDRRYYYFEGLVTDVGYEDVRAWGHVCAEDSLHSDLLLNDPYMFSHSPGMRRSPRI